MIKIPGMAFPAFPDLGEKHVLITGGANGIGEGVARAFAAQRARVTVLDKDAAAGERLVEQLPRGTDVTFHAVDLCDFDRLVPLLRGIEAQRGPVQVLVNNAAWDPRYRTTQMTW